MKKEFSKKKMWGSAAVLLVLIAVLVTLVGFGSGPGWEEQSCASPSPTLSVASSTASPVPAMKPAAKASASSKIKAESEVSRVEELQETKAETKKAAPPAESKAVEQKASSISAEASVSSSVPPVTTSVPVESTVSSCPTPAPTQAPTPKPKERVWVVDVPASTQQVWVDEQGHWEDKTYLTSDWVYRCNGCGQMFPTTGDVDTHQWAAFDNGEDHGGYTMVSGPMYEVSERVWVVDVEGHYETVTTPEQGHWEYQ